MLLVELGGEDAFPARYRNLFYMGIGAVLALYVPPARCGVTWGRMDYSILKPGFSLKPRVSTNKASHGRRAAVPTTLLFSNFITKYLIIIYMALSDA